MFKTKRNSGPREELCITSRDNTFQGIQRMNWTLCFVRKDRQKKGLVLETAGSVGLSDRDPVSLHILFLMQHILKQSPSSYILLQDVFKPPSLSCL